MKAQSGGVTRKFTGAVCTNQDGATSADADTPVNGILTARKARCRAITAQRSGQNRKSSVTIARRVRGVTG